MALSEYFTLNMIQNWEPLDYPHCSNCANARVMGDPAEPQVACAAGIGGPVHISRLIRPKSPRGWVSAVNCPQFDDMGPACNTNSRLAAIREVKGQH